MIGVLLLLLGVILLGGAIVDWEGMILARQEMEEIMEDGGEIYQDPEYPWIEYYVEDDYDER